MMDTMAESKKHDIPVTNEGLGGPLSAENQVLTAGAAVTQVREIDVKLPRCELSYLRISGR